MNWISTKDSPLYTEKEGIVYGTCNASAPFMAAIELSDGTYWVHHCLLDDEMCLNVIGEDHNQSASFEVRDIDFYMHVSMPFEIQ